MRVASNSFQWNQSSFGNISRHRHHHNQSVGDEEDDEDLVVWVEILMVT